MTIKRKLHLSTALIVCLVFVVGLVEMVSLTQLESKEAQRDLAANVQRRIVALELLAYEYALYHEARMRKQWYEGYTQLETIISQGNYPFPQHVSNHFKNILELFKQLNFLIQTHESSPDQFDEHSPDDIHTSAEESRILKEILIRSRNIHMHVTTQSKQASLESELLQEKYSAVLFAVGIGSAILIVSILFFLVRDITSSVQSLLRDIRKVGSGDLDHGIRIESEDEIGMIANAFREMTSVIKARDRTLMEVNEALEAKVAERTAKLSESQQRINAILENTVDGIVTIDQTGEIQSFNKASRRIFGYSSDDVIGRNVRMLMPEPYRSEHDGYLRNYLKTGIREVIGRPREVPGRRKDGAVFPMELAVSETDLPDTKIFTAMVRDVTEQKKIQDELRLHRDNLRQLVDEQTRELRTAVEAANAANRAKSQFLANMSHELRTPMHAIMGFADLGMMRGGDWSLEDQRENLAEIRDSGERLLYLLNDLLDLSKLEAKTSEFDFRTHDLRKIASDVVKSLQTLVDGKRLEVIIADCAKVEAECDRGKIYRVFTNLLSNAIKFTPEEKEISISFEERELPAGRRKDEDCIVPAIAVHVADQGIGIPDNELEIVFDKFIQSSATKTGAGGTGLGLAICREIINGHRGEIRAESTDHGGARLSFTIPLVQPAAGAAP